MKVVINTCYGGYSLSEEAYEELGLKWDGFGFAYEDDRTNPKLIATVEKLGDKASDSGSDLKVVEIPDDVDWYIEEHAGTEWIAEKHRTWY